MDPNWLVFDPHPVKPHFLLPPGSVDSHCHIFGPGDVFPYAPERKYTPCDASKAELFELRDFLGFERNVIVQATCHGTDNSALVDALQASGGRACGIVALTDQVTYDELAELHEAGVRGVRFNYVRRLVNPRPDDYYREIVRRVKPFGWHIQLYFEAADLESRWKFITSLETTVVVDHLGRPDVSKPVDGPDFERFMRLLENHPNIWAKATCPERLTLTGPPFDDVVPFARLVVETFPDRVLFGTDWPHPNLHDYMPNDGELVDFVPRIATSAEAQHKLLVDNPARLYFGGIS